MEHFTNYCAIHNDDKRFCPCDDHRTTDRPKEGTGEEIRADKITDNSGTSEKRETVIDIVNQPPHYTKGKIECIDAITEAIADLKGIDAHCTGNILKYLWRWKHKNGVEDLKKAKWYLDRLISEQP